MVQCPFCGVRLKIINGMYFCVNCGKVEFDSEESNGKERGYIN